MTLNIGATAPDFEADTTKGRIRFHEWLGDSWGVLFSHPKDFTPVCTTELGYLAKIDPEFKKRNTKVIGLSIDSVEDHNRWMGDIGKATGSTPGYPMIGDENLKVAKLYEMLPSDAGDTAAGRTAANNATVRTVYIIGPDQQIKATVAYPMSTGRNFDEILRLLDSCQLTAQHKIATPVNWKVGEDCIISPAVSDEDAKKAYPGGWTTKLPYLRTIPQPASKQP
jgi:alkyl hydroperoxide reductase subunit AhpC